ncbi:hypothetical protein [Streptomyces sporangiiformans]|uniref:Uncharacterized protein n=1 Tax=Streptomyces sporangiiformans TaxID=2315329 RepID=A0A505DC30_9ACTN|nr:hypothetical protein [Streptomyces sporangiiformans]TPQ20230.1 hypothetical protein FGD71_021430 [Streptomyces sporangiiformans]
MLDRFEADPSGCWSELMDHLCPQLDTAFTASFAALPRLAELASSCDTADRRWVLLAAGAITSCAPSGEDVFEVFSAPIADLHQFADQCLRETREAEDYIYLLQALLSFEGIEIWDRWLEGLHTGEYEVGCPQRGVSMFIKAPLRPASRDELDRPAARLHERTLADGQAALAGRLPYLFGQADCPDCLTVFPVADQVAAQWRPS